MKKIIIICLLIFSLGCSKKGISINNFKTLMRDNGYYVISIKDQFKSYSYIKEAYLARKNINVEFYIMSDSDNTKAFYDYNKDVIEAYKTKYDEYKESSNKYILSTDEKYMFISCIDNTCIYIDTDIKNKDEAINIIKKLGY